LNIFKADLHVHTLLSPCGDLGSTPSAIIETALRKGIDIIGITDHNSTLHCKLAAHYSKNRDIFVLAGAEVTTKEEAHCLCFFADWDSLDTFQLFIEAHLPDIMNNPDYFGDQVQIDENENIIFEETRLLTSALDVNIETIALKVKELGGIFIPAHIDKTVNSVISQLGYIPADLPYDGVEISEHGSKQKILAAHPYLANCSFIRGSDAHFTEKIASSYCFFEMETRNFDEIKRALHGEGGRRVYF